MCNFAVWHPRCGPCPSSELGGMLDGSALLGGNQLNGNITDTECDRLSNSVISEMQVRYYCRKDVDCVFIFRLLCECFFFLINFKQLHFLLHCIYFVEHCSILMLLVFLMTYCYYGMNDNLNLLINFNWTHIIFYARINFVFI